MIHYHGTPITPRSALHRMAGRHFCVSFADPRDADWCLQHGQSVMLDNGAFSAFTKGKPLDPAAFAAWAEPRLAHPHWCVVPDVIDGTVEDQRALIAAWQMPASLSAPVWHMGLPLDWLLELAGEWPRLCFGSTAEYWQIGGDAWQRRCDAAWNALERRGLRPWVHMLRAMSVVGGNRWPFASADSTNVARNHATERACPEAMAKRIDCAQTPAKWHMRAEQMDMLSAAGAVIGGAV